MTLWCGREAVTARAEDIVDLVMCGEEALRLPWQLEPPHDLLSSSRRPVHLDLVSRQIVCSELTPDDIGDPTALPHLLDQIDGRVDLFLADGAYDGDPTCAALTERFGLAIKVAIPPPKNAVLSPDAAQNPSIRDHHIADIAAHG